MAERAEGNRRHHTSAGSKNRNRARDLVVRYDVKMSPAEGQLGTPAMQIVIIEPLVALIAGILILIIPRLLNYIVAVYLIVVGVAGLLEHLG
jgi:hypothetical protein